jgi:type IV pilus assembly protein PilO
MTAVRNMRKWAQVSLIVLAVVCAASAAVLLTPIAGGRAAKLKEDEQVRELWQDERQKALPVHDIDQKIQEARSEITDFYGTRFPEHTSEVAIELGKQANDNDVKLSNVRYAAADETVEGLRELQLDASLSGDYVKVVKFINALERDKMFFLVGSIALGERGTGTITLQVHVETYLRETAAQNASGQ